MRKTIIVFTMAALFCTCGFGCQHKDPDIDPTEITAETDETEPTEEETVDLGENPDVLGDESDDERVETLGIYLSSTMETDENGEYEKATFSDINGIKFEAVISKDTEVSETLLEGEVYSVVHSNMMTLSVPGIYPKVYSIKEATDADASEFKPVEEPAPVAEVPETEVDSETEALEGSEKLEVIDGSEEIIVEGAEETVAEEEPVLEAETVEEK